MSDEFDKWADAFWDKLLGAASIELDVPREILEYRFDADNSDPSGVCATDGDTGDNGLAGSVERACPGDGRRPD